MQAATALIAPEIVNCLSEGREPTVRELCRVADQIEHDLQTSAAVPTLIGVGSNRPLQMRLALLALTGDPRT